MDCGIVARAAATAARSSSRTEACAALWEKINVDVGESRRCAAAGLGICSGAETAATAANLD